MLTFKTISNWSDLYQIKEFLKTHDVNVKDDDGLTALHFASEKGSIDIIQFLIDHGADVNAKDSDRRTPLDLARSEKRKDIVELLESK